MLRMRMNASDRQANSQKPDKKPSFSTLSLGIAFIATINNELH